MLKLIQNKSIQTISRWHEVLGIVRNVIIKGKWLSPLQHDFCGMFFFHKHGVLG
jgi:hypothetical protein